MYLVTVSSNTGVLCEEEVEGMPGQCAVSSACPQAAALLEVTDSVPGQCLPSPIVNQGASVHGVSVLAACCQVSGRSRSSSHLGFARWFMHAEQGLHTKLHPSPLYFVRQELAKLPRLDLNFRSSCLRFQSAGLQVSATTPSLLSCNLLKNQHCACWAGRTTRPV